MPLWPDIVVTRPDSPEVLLAVEAKAVVAGVKSAEAQLKACMVHMSCPVGMLVTWEETRFYRNRYTDYEPQTVEMIGACATNELPGPMPAKSSLADSYLERLVEERSESLRLDARRSWPSPVREAIEANVLQAVIGGMVRAAGPRWRRTGS
jgi:hypothetical protein